jgi:hypothetical protein
MGHPKTIFDATAQLQIPRYARDDKAKITPPKPKEGLDGAPENHS